jgi:hypothetical protein
MAKIYKRKATDINLKEEQPPLAVTPLLEDSDLIADFFNTVGNNSLAENNDEENELQNATPQPRKKAKIEKFAKLNSLLPHLKKANATITTKKTTKSLDDYVPGSKPHYEYNLTFYIVTTKTYQDYEKGMSEFEKNKSNIATVIVTISTPYDAAEPYGGGLEIETKKKQEIRHYCNPNQIPSNFLESYKKKRREKKNKKKNQALKQKEANSQKNNNDQNKTNVQNNSINQNDSVSQNNKINQNDSISQNDTNICKNSASKQENTIQKNGPHLNNKNIQDHQYQDKNNDDLDLIITHGWLKQFSRLMDNARTITTFNSPGQYGLLRHLIPEQRTIYWRARNFDLYEIVVKTQRLFGCGPNLRDIMNINSFPQKFKINANSGAEAFAEQNYYAIIKSGVEHAKFLLSIFRFTNQHKEIKVPDVRKHLKAKKEGGPNGYKLPCVHQQTINVSKYLNHNGF